MSEDAKIVNYKCPNCSGALEFVIQSQMWECKFCGSSFTKDQLDKINVTFSTEDGRAPTVSWTTDNFNEGEVTVYNCPDCGGEVITDKITVATFCAYCHNPTIIAGKLKGQYKPRVLIPFKITKKEALDKLRDLIRKKPLLPKIFKKCVEKGEIAGLYVPYWLFSADADVYMDLDGKRITRWSDSRYNYTKTDSYFVERSGTIPVRHLPVDASSRLDNKMMDSVEPYNYSELSDFSMQYLSGHMAESYDVKAEDCQARFAERTRSAARSMVEETVRGYNITTVSRFTCNFLNSDVIYAMLPVWTISVKHNGKIYSFVVNAQTGKSAGKLPISGQRVAAFLLGSIALVTIIASVVRLLI